jgi:hypothetical protein
MLQPKFAIGIEESLQPGRGRWQRAIKFAQSPLRLAAGTDGHSEPSFSWQLIECGLKGHKAPMTVLEEARSGEIRLRGIFRFIDVRFGSSSPSRLGASHGKDHRQLREKRLKVKLSKPFAHEPIDQPVVFPRSD